LTRPAEGEAGGGDQTQAARVLGIGRKALYRKSNNTIRSPDRKSRAASPAETVNATG
jgi:DNA-binding NtrC family response regulator